jgi:hypothetical protein
MSKSSILWLIGAKLGLETCLPQIMIFVYICSTGGIVDLNTRFEMWITRTDVNGVIMFHLSYLITRIVYLWSQRTPNVQRRYFMFDWSIYGLFVLNWAWKIFSHEIILLVYVSSTRCIDELNRRFETWITRNDVNSVCFKFLI